MVLQEEEQEHIIQTKEQSRATKDVILIYY